MSEQLKADTSKRLVSLDAFRGITIAGMILVNHPGSWGHMYWPLGHADWHGWTPTDLIFPFFLFIVGVAMSFSFDKRLSLGQDRLRIFEQVVRRTILLYLLGSIMYGFRFSFQDGSVIVKHLRLIAPFVLGVVGVQLLFKDEPPLGLGKTPRERNIKIAAWGILAAAVLWFVLDFRFFDSTKLRMVGVLQRIAICYFLASIIMFYFGTRGRAVWAAALLIGYWLLIKFVQAPASYFELVQNAKDALALDPKAADANSLVALYKNSINVPVARPDGALGDWFDILLLKTHLYSERPDPEGLLSTLPAIASTLLGILTGAWLRGNRSGWAKVRGMVLAGVVLLVAGLLWNLDFPISKKLWSSSFVVLTTGLALLFLAFCYALIDLLGKRAWSVPFLVYGTNAILVYFAAHMISKCMGLARWTAADGTAWSVYGWLYKNLFVPWAGELNGSLAFALTYTILWCLLLVPLYRKKIFVKV